MRGTGPGEAPFAVLGSVAGAARRGAGAAMRFLIAAIACVLVLSGGTADARYLTVKAGSAFVFDFPDNDGYIRKGILVYEIGENDGRRRAPGDDHS
jgi:hypothetical protein